MLTTMQDGELSVTRLLRYGTSVHGGSAVKTWTGTGSRAQNYREVGIRAARLAHSLRALGVDGDQRVATFMWNNSEHLHAYLAVPAMGAVLHTLNIRMSQAQLTFISNHARDHVLMVDASLAPRLSGLLPRLETVRHVVVANGDSAMVEAPAGILVHSYDDLTGAQPNEFAWPAVDERSAAAMCYTSGTTGDPKGVVYSHRSIWLHSMQICMSDAMGLAQRDRALPIVPMFHAMAWGLPYAAMMIGASLVMPDHFLQPAQIAEIFAAEKPTFAAGVPTIWQGLLAHLEEHPQDLSYVRQLVSGGSACPLGAVAHPPSGASGDEYWAYRATQGPHARPGIVDREIIAGQRQDVPRAGPLRSRLPTAASEACQCLLAVRSYHDRNRTRADPKPTFISDGAC